MSYPGFTIDQNKALADLADAMRGFNALMGPANASLNAQRQAREEPFQVEKFYFDIDSTPTTAREPKIAKEINHPHQCMYFQDSNSNSAYFWYRPISKAYEKESRWIKVKKGDIVRWPFPVEKAYIWYPDQALLTGDVVFFKYGDVDTATINTISLNAGSGSSVVSKPFTASGAAASAPLTQTAAVVLPPLTTRTKSWIKNDSGGSEVWLGSSDVVFGTNGFQLLPGESMEWTNVGPLYGICDAGQTSTIYGMEERQ